MNRVTWPFSHLERRWHEQQRLPKEELQDTEFTPLQVQLLHNRGIKGAAAHAAFMQAEWQATSPLLTALETAVARIQQALANQERIVVFGDYDCDGITSCVLLTSALRLLGADVEPYIPTREDDGRGLNAEAVQKLAANGTKLLITTDCGTSNVEEAKLAHDLGIEVIITDHHPLHGASADVLALINPQRPDDASKNKDIAGVGVAFRLVEALAQRVEYGELKAALPALLDLVAIGTVADVVPLSLENWVLAHAGLATLNQSPRVGIAALAKYARLTPGQISERDISFTIAPRLNAAGRLGQPRLATQLLLTTDPREADRLASELDQLNSERQRQTDDVLAAARRQLAQQDAVLMQHVVIVQGQDWPLGILGLVAGRLADEYQRPAFVISRAETEARGSARGRSESSNINLGQILAQWQGEFKRFGGHAQAAGFTIANNDLDSFTSYLRDVLVASDPLNQPEQSQDKQAAGEAGETLMVDCELPLSSIAQDRYEQIRALAPFGTKFSEPLFVTKHLKLLRCWRSGVEGRTLRLTLGEKEGSGITRNFLLPRQGTLYEKLQASLSTIPLLDVVYTLDGYQRRDGSFDLTPRIITVSPARQA